ncbi:MAG: ATP-binding cassette domain-containing protein [Acholeplasmatales bacterium]|jgi:putative ABC transport system permease protein|nr:ATP-binding cassette domain-containing protein [Acholeplasmatales bacterium]
MLELTDIKKNYIVGDQIITALSDVNISFREKEFVVVIGPSGCGKSTLLNLIGGLDTFTSGDLKIDKISTKNYKNRDWDTYRNHKIGFVFQNYNLISHLNVIQNVELALTLTGDNFFSRREKAKIALKRVGLEEKLNSKISHLSGGQIQRVAIARAIVTNPSILLADEPTGALDSKSSIQILDILKELSKDKLIIMVTHNIEQATKYADRTVSLLDGKISNDTNPYVPDNKEKINVKNRKSKMSFPNALKLSFNNLKTKVLRTLVAALGGSIGIIGVALVIGVNNGFLSFVNTVRSSSSPSSAVQVYTGQTFSLPDPNDRPYPLEAPFNDNDFIKSQDTRTHATITYTNFVSGKLVDYIKKLPSSLAKDVTVLYQYTPTFYVLNSNNVITKLDYSLSNSALATANSYISELLFDDKEFVTDIYDLLYGRYPSQDELATILLVDDRSELPDWMLNRFGFDGFDYDRKFSFEEITSLKIKMVYETLLYDLDPETNKYYKTVSNTSEIYEKGIEVPIVGILRRKKNSVYRSERGIRFTSGVSEYMRHDIETSSIYEDQMNNLFDFMIGKNKKLVSVFDDADHTFPEIQDILLNYGLVQVPYLIRIYQEDSLSRRRILDYLLSFNDTLSEKDVGYSIYLDTVDRTQLMVDQILGSVNIVMIAVAVVCLLITGSMICIITYVSVVERTKEIGILRALGARKRDVSLVFNAEAVIIGFITGLLGVFTTFLLAPFLNKTLYNLTDIDDIIIFNWFHAVLIVSISIIITFIASSLPAHFASKKNPVLCLRAD